MSIYNISSRNTSGFKGVFLNKQYHGWYVICRKDKKDHYAGYFKNRRDAARAYDKKAVELYGDLALTNKKLGLLGA